ncbi:MAG: SGNH/GDSL hydrolase family protein [Chthoniobacter sp.]|uniref:SGNH/GDSL hydrolase family protein n=1 Tax=Chthoniobacter sp. TaxID=2510640 RepID=UPI0032A6A83F
MLRLPAYFVLLFLCLWVASTPAAEKASSTPAPEATRHHAAYLAWMATLPPEQQAWEKLLQQNLGKANRLFYERDRVAGKQTEYDYAQDDPRLPRVLLIGDSISCGYTLPVRQALAGKANVHRAPENCAATANGVKKLDVWLDGQKWDLVYFNFGLHDLTTPPAEYEQRLDEITTRLVNTGAKIVWASTTPAPPDTAEGASICAAIVERNAIAAAVMKKHRIPTDDLFTFITPHVAEIRKPHDIHYNAEGYKLLGQQVAATIASNLGSR